MVAISRGKDESSCVLEKIQLVVFKSCLQRSKDMIFKGLVMRVWLWWWWRKEEEDEDEEEVKRSLRVKERMRSHKMKNECVHWGGLAVSFIWVCGSIFS